MKPNVLLVVLDAARRDALTPYGASVHATPAIADLAARGHALPFAYATSSWTLPSHASLLAGVMPRPAGLGQPPGGDPAGARPLVAGLGERLLPARLKGAGYDTHGYSANLWASGHAGFDTGFDTFDYLPSRRDRRRWVSEALLPRHDDGAAAIGGALRDAIARWSGTPAFWFVNLVECHSPYLPPRRFNDLPAAARVLAARDSRKHLSFESICLYAAGAATVPAPALKRMRHLYHRAIAYMDAWLADVLHALEQRRILEQTLVIVTADHGESFGETGLMAHGFSLAEHLIHVPLVLAGPGARRINRAFSLAELPDLVAEAAGLMARPPELSGLPPAGVAVAQYDALAATDDPRIRAFADEWVLDDDNVARLTASYTAATDGRHKLVRGVPGDASLETLYDLSDDRDERAPITGHDDVRSRLRSAMDAAESGAVSPGAAAPPAAAPAKDLAQIEQQMRLLGYL